METKFDNPENIPSMTSDVLEQMTKCPICQNWFHKDEMCNDVCAFCDPKQAKQGGLDDNEYKES